MEDTDGDPIEARLRRAQAAVEQDAAKKERRDAVVAALEAGKSKYWIGKVLGVSPTTVDSILKAAGHPAGR